MAWERVGGGLVGGRTYEVRRQVFHFVVPGSGNAHWSVRRKAYRLHVEQPDGSFAVVRRACTKDLLMEALSD